MSDYFDDERSVVEMEVLKTDKLYSMTEICTICGLDESSIYKYMEYDIIVSESLTVCQFRQPQLDRLLRATRLHNDLELNHAGVALALELLETIDLLKQEMSRLRR